jgi:predicted nucleic acid-binding protein
MSLVVDANVALALVLPLPYSREAEQLWQAWHQRRETVYAPDLWGYEVTSGLRKAIVLSSLSTEYAEHSLEILLDLCVQLIPPTADLHRLALCWAGRLGQTAAYDAHYLALAEALKCAFWTADQRLMRMAQQHGDRIHGIGEIL